MSKLVLALAGVFVLAAAAPTAQAAVTVTQDGGNLYVVGDNTDDSVIVANEKYQGQWTVHVTDNQTGEEDYYYGVDDVWVDTGNGDDYVQAEGAFTFDLYGADIHVDTGNGKDEVTILSYYYGNHIDVSTGNGDDFVFVSSNYSLHYGGGIAIDTGNGDDEVFLWCLNESLDIDLGNGDDTIYGPVDDCGGTIDGNKGDDSCSGLDIAGGTLEVMNCED